MINTINEGDMVLINKGSRVNTGYISGTIVIPYLGTCYTIVEISETGESKLILSLEKTLECKAAYESVLGGMDSHPLIHGINNGYSDW